MTNHSLRPDSAFGRCSGGPPLGQLFIAPATQRQPLITVCAMLCTPSNAARHSPFHCAQKRSNASTTPSRCLVSKLDCISFSAVARNSPYGGLNRVLAHPLCSLRSSFRRALPREDRLHTRLQVAVQIQHVFPKAFYSKSPVRTEERDVLIRNTPAFFPQVPDDLGQIDDVLQDHCRRQQVVVADVLWLLVRIVLGNDLASE